MLRSLDLRAVRVRLSESAYARACVTLATYVQLRVRKRVPKQSRVQQQPCAHARGPTTTKEGDCPALLRYEIRLDVTCPM
eukprot:6175417-Pleurochrysis_carterae.AAC.2